MAEDKLEQYFSFWLPSGGISYFQAPLIFLQGRGSVRFLVLLSHTLAWRVRIYLFSLAVGR